MAHQIIGIQQAEVDHHSHTHSHGEAAEAARSAGVWLFVTLLGGLLVLTSYLVQWYSPRNEAGEYLYQFHMDLVAGGGALLLAIRNIWHALGNLIRGQQHTE